VPVDVSGLEVLEIAPEGPVIDGHGNRSVPTAIVTPRPAPDG